MARLATADLSRPTAILVHKDWYYRGCHDRVTHGNLLTTDVEALVNTRQHRRSDRKGHRVAVPSGIPGQLQGVPGGLQAWGGRNRTNVRP